MVAVEVTPTERPGTGRTAARTRRGVDQGCRPPAGDYRTRRSGGRQRSGTWEGAGGTQRWGWTFMPLWPASSPSIQGSGGPNAPHKANKAPTLMLLGEAGGEPEPGGEQ